MSRKRKRDHLFNIRNIFFIHSAAYIFAMLMYWYAFVAEINFPGNASVPRSVFAAVSLERFNFTLLWGLILLIHLGIVLGHNSWKQRQIQQANSDIGWDEDMIGSRLIEQRSDRLIDDSILMEAYQDEQQEQS